MLLNDINFFSYLNNLKCFEKYPHVAVGVSGGPDSIALVYLINKWIKTKQGKLSALIFDHKIRNNSKQESYYVRDILRDLNINARILIKIPKITASFVISGFGISILLFCFYCFFSPLID